MQPARKRKYDGCCYAQIRRKIDPLAKNGLTMHTFAETIHTLFETFFYGHIEGDRILCEQKTKNV